MRGLGSLVRWSVTRAPEESGMAKLSYVANVSLDGYIEDAQGRFDWTEPTDEYFAFITDLVRPVGTYLYGRRLYEAMAVWETDPTLAAPLADLACRRLEASRDGDRARVGLDRARRGPALALLDGTRGDRDVEAALRERECRAPADAPTGPRDHGLGSRAVSMLAHARIVPSTLEPRTRSRTSAQCRSDTPLRQK